MDTALMAAGATVIAPVVPTVMDVVANIAKKGVDAVSEKVVQEFKVGFRDALQKSYDRCSEVRTLTCGDNPSLLRDIYVNLKLRNGDFTYTDKEVISGLEGFRRIVITGTGGAGKSMFMRYLTLSRFEKGDGKVPIFVELRLINNVTQFDLMTYCFYSFNSQSSKMTYDGFMSMVKKGAFIFVFDGFDEVDPHLKVEIERQILQFASEYPQAVMVVSSRADAKLDSWQMFRVFHVCELDEVGAFQLVSKIKFDAGVKKRFLKELPALWTTHASFLSIPLLSALMLMTFGRFSEISPKFTLFYRLAFQTLFREHDARKEQFRREIRSKLDLSDFEKMFSAFCCFSYLNHQYSFFENEAMEYARRAKDYCRIDVNEADFFQDLVDALCVIRKDGAEYSFVHRSFQEYFTALFLKDHHGDDFSYIAGQVARRSSDRTLFMAFELDTPKMEKYWLEGFVKEFEKNLRSCRKVDPKKHELCMIFKQVFLGDHLEILGFSQSENDYYHTYENILECYLSDWGLKLTFSPEIRGVSEFFMLEKYLEYPDVVAKVEDGKERCLSDEWFEIEYTFDEHDFPWMDKLLEGKIIDTIKKANSLAKSKIKHSKNALSVVRLS